MVTDAPPIEVGRAEKALGRSFLTSSLKDKLCKEGAERGHGDSLGRRGWCLREIRGPRLGGAEVLEDPGRHSDDLGLHHEVKWDGLRGLKHDGICALIRSTEGHKSD